MKAFEKTLIAPVDKVAENLILAVPAVVKFRPVNVATPVVALVFTAVFALSPAIAALEVASTRVGVTDSACATGLLQLSVSVAVTVLANAAPAMTSVGCWLTNSLLASPAVIAIEV